MKSTVDGVIISNRPIAKGVYSAWISFNGSEAPVPGQFAHLTVPGVFLRRPISVADYDSEGCCAEFIYKIVGEGTKNLSLMTTGAGVNAIFPLGHGFDVPEGTKTGFLVGGGMGVAPLKYVLRKYPDVAWKCFFGYSDAASVLPGLDELCSDITITTDDGSLGQKGLITGPFEDALWDEQPDIILSCGPEPMTKAVQRIAAAEGVPAQLSLEERMGCGIGGCRVCACKIKRNGEEGYLRACVEGPVFPADEIVFES